MATGAGKTRTVIALVDLLMRANWVKRVLFLADRMALVNQAVNAFKTHLPGRRAGQPGDREGRRGPGLRLDLPDDDGPDRRDRRRPAPLRRRATSTSIVIDEAHRSVYQKYRAIFDYFDSLLVGLTATPKDEVDRNTYSLFDLEDGVPTDAYGLDEAVDDGLPRAAEGGVGAAPSSCARASATTTCPRRRRTSGTRWSGTRTATSPTRVERRGAQPVAVQRRHRRQGAGAPDDRRAQGRRRRPARQDHHLRQEPGATPSSSQSASTSTTRELRRALRPGHHLHGRRTPRA